MKTEIINGQKVRCYDNGGKTCDRYTVAFLDRPEVGGTIECLGMSEHPSHPQGFGQHSCCVLGRHLGKRIAIKDLPIDCQKLIDQVTRP